MSRFQLKTTVDLGANGTLDLHVDFNRNDTTDDEREYVANLIRNAAALAELEITEPTIEQIIDDELRDGIDKAMTQAIADDIGVTDDLAGIEPDPPAAYCNDCGDEMPRPKALIAYRLGASHLLCQPCFIKWAASHGQTTEPDEPTVEVNTIDATAVMPDAELDPVGIEPDDRPSTSYVVDTEAPTAEAVERACYRLTPIERLDPGVPLARELGIHGSRVAPYVRMGRNRGWLPFKIESGS